MLTHAPVLLGALVLLCLVAAACSDGPSSEQLAQELRIRENIRDAITDGPNEYRFICAALDGLTNQQAAEGWARGFVGGVATERDDFSEDRLIMQIMREECDAFDFDA